MIKYYTDNRVYNFKANVTVSEERDGNFHLELDQTYFYPEGGGQPSDKGSISGIELIDVKKIDSKVIHILKEKPDTKEVNCIIDRQFRDHYMVQHSGQHLISAVLKHELNIDTLSVHLGVEKTTIEVDISEITEDEISRLEDKCYDLITNNRSFIYHETDDDGLKKFNIRRESKFTGYIRLVEIDGYDCVPCGGVHLSNLHEIGIIKFCGFEKIRGNIRLNFLIGKNALLDYGSKYKIINSLNRELSTKDNEILDNLQKLNKTISTLKVERKNIFSKYSSQIVSSTIIKNPGLIIFKDLPVELLQNISKELTKKLEKPILLIGINEKINWVIIDSKEPTINFSTLKEICLIPNSFKGGGRSPIWQGSGIGEGLKPFNESIIDYFSSL